MSVESPEYSKTLIYLVEVETVSQDILTLKDTKLELANSLGKLQECLRVLQTSNDRRSYLKVGSLFIQHSTENCIVLIQKEMEELKEQYDAVSIQIKDNISKKRDIEHEPKIEGFGLKPLSHAEAKGLMKGFGIN
ncbi:hypothetical protein FQA39_LY07063 [Lamprigera yunnana]|nr:hypothetical protein FQA39_LY07063 [Lamprigera yunnana]